MRNPKLDTRSSLSKTLTKKAALSTPLVKSSNPSLPSIRTETRPKVVEKLDVLTEGKSNALDVPSVRPGQESRNGTFGDSSNARIEIITSTVEKKVEKGHSGKAPGTARRPIAEEERANYNNPANKKRKIIQNDGLRSRPGIQLVGDKPLSSIIKEDRSSGLQSNPTHGSESRTSSRSGRPLSNHPINSNIKMSGVIDGTSKLTAEEEHKDFLARAKEHLDIINQKLTDNRKRVMNEYRTRLNEIDEYMEMCYQTDLKKKTADPKKKESLDKIVKDFKEQFQRMIKQSKEFEGHRGLVMHQSSG